MEKTIEPVNFNASQELIDHVDEIFEKLPKYHDRIVKADIYLKTVQGSPTKEKMVEVKVFLPGKEVFVKHAAESFISAAQQTYDKVKYQLTKEKEKDKENRNK